MATQKPISRGAFIVIEGLDRSGKTTQVKRLEAELLKAGGKVKLIRFPDRTTTIGQMIDRYLQSKSDLEDHVIHLLFSANRWELSKQMEKDLSDGYTVICDRYCYSGMIYSAAKCNPALSLSWARWPDVGLPRPDLVIFLDLKPEDAEKRGGFGDEKYEKKQMQQNVRQLFYTLKDIEEEESEDMVIIDAGGSIDEVSEKILDSVHQRILLGSDQRYQKEVRRVGKWKNDR